MARKKTAAYPDELLIEQAKSALLEVASADHIGSPGVSAADSGVFTVTFPSLLPGYPGWNWVVSLADGDGGDLGVLEMHLLPGDGALLAPDWVPWSERMEEYLRQEADRDSEDGDTDDVDDIDDDIDDVLDGVDIDQLDLDPSALEVPDEPNDVFDHVDLDEED